jgi:NhaC family Na+:H+ antiporter
MLYTTLPSITITLFIFVMFGLTFSYSGEIDTSSLKNAIAEKFNINAWLFLVPVLLLIMIIKKTPPLIALSLGSLLGAFFALIFQPNLLVQLAGVQTLNFKVAFQGILDAITIETNVATSEQLLSELFTSGGMQGMLGTIWLIICAMVFGGIMDAIGALETISNSILNWAKSKFQLFAGTVASCLTVNLSASDQYLAIVVPGKMFNMAYKDKKLAPENLSRTLEDSGTVTSVLIPWNTCGAYQSSVLGVNVADYFLYAIFNWLSPLMTLIIAYFKIKIKSLTKF